MDSQNLLVISDTHGDLAALEAIFRWAKSRNFTAAVFLGDGEADLAPASAATGFACKWEKVRGNGDSTFATPEADVHDFGDRRLFLVHGHRYALYNGYGSLAAAARSNYAEAALFGHTHIPCYDREDGILLINPGSVGRPRSRIGPTFAVLEIPSAAGKPLVAHFWGLGPGRKVFELEQLTHK